MKISIIGGGSYAWTPILVSDFLHEEYPEALDIHLMDINEAALADILRLCEIYHKAAPGKRITFRGTTDLGMALDGASFVVVSVSHGGLEAELEDHRIGRRFGFANIKGSEVGVAGCSRTLRHVPEMVRIGRAMERRCPRAELLNVSNPLTACTRAVTRYTGIPAVGFCHGVVNREEYA